MKHCWSAAPRWAGPISTRCREASAKVTFRLGDGRMLDLAPGDQQLRRIDQAWASTVHAFEGGTVDTVIAAMEAKHPNLTNLKTLYVEISHRAQTPCHRRRCVCAATVGGLAPGGCEPPPCPQQRLSGAMRSSPRHGVAVRRIA